MKNTLVIFLFNSSLTSGCDYVLQTIRIVSKENFVYGLAMGDIISVPKLFFSKDRWIYRRIENALIVRPISILPGIRSEVIKKNTYMVWAFLVCLYCAVRYPKKEKKLWIFEPFYIPSLLALFHSYKTIYDCVDYYPGFSDEARVSHAVLLQRADYVFANSSPLADQLRKNRGDVIHVPLGFATSLFQKNINSSRDQNNKHLTVGFVGSISDRIDFDLVISMVKSMPNVRFVFIGPIEKDVFGKRGNVASFVNILQKNPNAFLRKPVKKERVPDLINNFDIGLIPYRIDNTFNKYSFPMKTLEYFASGVPVIATDIEALRPYVQKKFVYTIQDAKGAQNAVLLIQKKNWQKQAQEKLKDVAIQNSWERKMQAIYRVIDPKGSVNANQTATKNPLAL